MQKGDRVKVMNSTLTGKPVVEGMATVVRLVGRPDGGRQRCVVHFEEDSPDQVVERWIEEGGTA